MYERFTDSARKAMQAASLSARRFYHEYIGTEHILIALTESDSVAAVIFRNLAIDRLHLRQETEKLLHCGPVNMVTMGNLPQTPRAKKVIEYSMEEARNLGHAYVGTEHLLLGLAREQDGVASQVLASLGATIDRLREDVLRVIGGSVKTAKATDACGVAYVVREFMEGVK